MKCVEQKKANLTDNPECDKGGLGWVGRRLAFVDSPVFKIYFSQTEVPILISRMAIIIINDVPFFETQLHCDNNYDDNVTSLVDDNNDYKISKNGDNVDFNGYYGNF